MEKAELAKLRRVAAKRLKELESRGPVDPKVRANLTAWSRV